MAKLQIAPDKQHFTRGGEPFFWVGDTLWSAFTNPTFEEWAEYLAYRKAQGFNVIQINTLPQWDRIKPDLGIYPYPMLEGEGLDYTADPNPEYITRAQKICQMAVDAGFTLALVVDWGDIVPGTWLNHVCPTHVWPLDAVEKHVRRVVEYYDRFDPVYIVSGDTDLRSEETIAYYQRTINILKEIAPDSLRTMHLCGGFIGLTPELAEGLDFYVYQSGHGENSVDTLDTLPVQMRKQFPGKPILNAEPCYEKMPKMPADWHQPPKALYDADDVYDACRRSILAGANAGITYGANGLWNWKREEGVAEGVIKDMYGDTATWREAMHFPGAGRIAGLKDLAY